MVKTSEKVLLVIDNKTACTKLGKWKYYMYKLGRLNFH